ncbi:dihydrolipoyl dehydrogenase family protein [Natrinema sp. 74]|uniref:dihydrolipoyl dehydrogenase family protein n=1 Tax=Natrinema sp. 74 TaxID=3384159 RepID=UPI0038D4E2C9
MSDFDLIIVGGGTGNNTASAAARSGLDVALVEKRSLGGTCLTRGCDPSKTLVHRANVVEGVRQAEQFGIEAEVTDIDFSQIVAESTEPFDEKAAHMEDHIRDAENVTFYGTEAEFVDERTLSVGDEEITGENIVIAAGSRPIIPSAIDGIEDVDYITSDEVLRLDERPDHLVIVGGGYIAAEMGYVYGTLGSDVTIIGRSDDLLPREDTDVRETFTDIYERRYDVHTGHEATAVSQDGKEITVEAETDEGDRLEVTGDELLMATGRRPNSDTLRVEEAGIETDDDEFVKVNEYLETSAENVWAIGDIVGNYMFWHSALHEAEYVYRSVVSGRRDPIEYPGMAHAIFADPEVASMGKTEGELENEGREYDIGTYDYDGVALGIAMKAEDSFAKVVADSDSGELLGCHILGPDASTLIHEVMIAARVGDGTVSEIADAIHIHPALNEVVQRACDDV